LVQTFINRVFSYSGGIYAGALRIIYKELMKQLLFILILITGCGGGTSNSAEAWPKNQDARLIIVDSAISYNDAIAAFDLAASRIKAQLKKKITLASIEDVTDDGPAITLINFWNSVLYRHWFDRFEAERKRGTFIVIMIKPLSGAALPLYGAWSEHQCASGNQILMNVEPGNIVRDAAILNHEFGHSYGAIDLQYPDPANAPPPSIMDVDAGPWLKTAQDPQYSWASIHQMRQCLKR
jgi:hypothetical protein